MLLPMLNGSLQASLVARYANAVMKGAALPVARRSDVEDAPTFSAADGEIVCTCSITGSTSAEPWDGTRAAAEAFADVAGESTAKLVARTTKNHHYAWLYASR
jgi:hypothetical protein